MTEFIISSDQLERLIEAVEHNTGREINQVVIDGVRALEIVRCRDCKRWTADDCEWNRFLDDPEIDEPDGFCAWGERRGDA